MQCAAPVGAIVFGIGVPVLLRLVLLMMRMMLLMVLCCCERAVRHVVRGAPCSG